MFRIIDKLVVYSVLYVLNFGGFMEKVSFTHEEKKAIFGLFGKCDVALIKVSFLENGEKHIDKVFLDGKLYDIPSKDLTHQIYLCDGAVDLIREKGSILKLSRDEQNFVIRNHPAWMLLGGAASYYDFNDSEYYGVFKNNLKQPYNIWCQDYMDSVGERRFYPRKNMKSYMMTYEEFMLANRLNPNRVNFELKEGLVTSFSNDASPLYRGFFEATRVKFEDREDLKVELNKYGYPEVYHLKNGKQIKIDVSTEEGLEKLFELSPSPIGKVESNKGIQKVKKRPTKKGKKRK